MADPMTNAIAAYRDMYRAYYSEYGFPSSEEDDAMWDKCMEDFGKTSAN